MVSGEMLLAALYRARRLVREHWLTVPLAALILYFGYHAIHGNRGLVAWMDKKRELALLEAERERLLDEKTELLARVRALEPSGVDADLLESELRRLGYVRPGELVVLWPERGEPSATQP